MANRDAYATEETQPRAFETRAQSDDGRRLRGFATARRLRGVD